MTLLEKIKLVFGGRKALAEGVKQARKAKEVYVKSSWKSTEFWFTVLTGLGAVAAQVSGIIPPPYGPLIAAGSAALYSFSRGLAKKDDPNGGEKPGYQTTEFWVSALASLGSVFSAAQGAVDPQTAAALLALSNGSYSLSRGLAKSGAQPDGK